MTAKHGPSSSLRASRPRPSTRPRPLGAGPAAAALVGALLTTTCGGVWCPPENRCGARCVDLESDASHCGACGVRCVHPATCEAGTCQAPCPPAYHDGGDGSCHPRDRCAPGYHDGGDGVCVEEGTCRPGYRDGGDGACYPRGACAPGHHDGGDGLCYPTDTCAEGFAPDRHGRCREPGPCSAGLAVSTETLDFGRTRPGEPRRRLLVVTPAPGAEACALASLAFHDGTAPYFSLGEDRSDLDVLDAGETAALWIHYAPDRFGRHGGRLTIDVDDPHAPREVIPLDAAAVATDLHPDEPILDLGSVAPGDSAARWSCLRNAGTADARVTTVRLVDEAAHGLLLLEYAPSPDTLVAGGDRLCVRIRLEADRAGLHAGALFFEIDDDLPPVVVQILGHVD
jgi:hypothetical protein